MVETEKSPSTEAPVDEQLEKPAHRGTTGKRFNIPLAYLRAFIIVLVVAHHAAVSYNIALPPPPAPSLAEHVQSMHAISPVNDAQRSGMLSLFNAFNDTFFMPLLLFVSGLFVWASLLRKGRSRFLLDRLIRLGLPLVAMIVLRPLTYYPTYLQTGGSGGFSDFWQQWSAISWRGGPIWFLEVLLIFNVLVVLASGLKGNTGGLLERMLSDIPIRPAKTYVLLVLLSALAYIPITAAYGDFLWLQVGPAQIEMNRVLLYAVYFLAGVVFGGYGIERTFLVPDSGLARRWVIWTVVALVAFIVEIGMSISGGDETLIGLLYVVACATLSFAFLAISLRFVRRRRRAFDSVFHNGYGIYVIHYGVISWLAYALLGARLPAMAKFTLVFAAALAICWGASAAIRRIPGVARVI